MRYRDHFHSQTINSFQSNDFHSAERHSVLRLLLFISIAVLGVVFPCNTQGQPRLINDASIKAAVENKLEADADVSVDIIDIAVNQGVVTLAGPVHDTNSLSYRFR